MENSIFVTKSSMPEYEEYIEAIKPLWESHLLTNMGKYHQELEVRLKNFLEVEELSLMVNGHMALELTLQSFGFPEGAEIITTPFTFVSTTHAIVRNHLKPVFCDVKECDGTIDETKIEELITEKTVAILPVHVYGNICNVEEIQRIAEKYGLKVIYDAAHAFGIKHKGKSVACYGDASIFSFHATKVFNTIEGGAVIFSEHKMYERLYNLKNFGIHGEELVVEVGTNAKMNEFSAIMGLCNLKHYDREKSKRQMVYQHYIDGMANIKGISVLLNNNGTKNYGYMPIIFSDEYRYSRDEVYDILRENRIYSRKYFYPITADQACFDKKYEKANLDNARKLSKQVLTLPMYSDLDISIIDYIMGLLQG